MNRNYLFIVVLLFSMNGCKEQAKEKDEQEPPTSMKDISEMPDPLPSWNEGQSKKAIRGFVKSVTGKNGNAFIKEEDRIAVFDNDGTLWVEQPAYTQFLFAIDRVKALAPKHPEWKNLEPYKSILEGNTEGLKAGGKKAVVELLKATHAGMSTEEFAEIVEDWISTARHPRLNRPYTRCIYQPMLELIDYLKANGFKVFIVSGGGIEFMRPWSDSVYGVPPAQVIGSRIKTRYEVRDGKPLLIRLPELDFMDDREGKPAGIHEHIGRRPLAAFGNSDGDFQMLEWTTSGRDPAFGLIVHHDDAEREYAYDRESIVGKLDRASTEAPQRGWIVVSMKNDWNRIFPE